MWRVSMWELLSVCSSNRPLLFYKKRKELNYKFSSVFIVFLYLKIKNNFFEMLISVSQVCSSEAGGWLAALYFKYLYWNWKYTNTKYWNNSGNTEVGRVPDIQSLTLSLTSSGNNHFINKHELRFLRIFWFCFWIIKQNVSPVPTILIIIVCQS